jgi:hypothetical protein
MQTNRLKDIILIAAVVAIAVAALLPARAPAPAERPPERRDRPPDEGAPGAGTGVAKPAAPAPPERAPGPTSAPSTAFVVAVGSAWVYHVEGPGELVPDNRWTLEVRSLPDGEAPGEVAAGFGAERLTYPLWIEGGAIRLAALPFVEPLELRGTRPTAVEGILVPSRGAFGEGAVWSQRYERGGEHEMTNAKGKPARVAVQGVQNDRALAGEQAVITVPAGSFPARRVDWTGRIELAAGARPVLDPLTAAPFRKEVMWIATGVGIVRRRVEHALPTETVITFDLVSYTIPPTAGGE